MARPSPVLPVLRERRRRPPTPRPGSPGTPWRIGVAHPLRPGELATATTAHHDLAVAASGTAVRGAHILDPHRGHLPPRTPRSPSSGPA
ncbi:MULTISPECIES: hypothetical protein [unclassified Streptomyces]|uniref:hypothetical protein n=1 Tax=unclassified Streptomyces TaxID=2593676 RepID=UPI0038059690